MTGDTDSGPCEFVYRPCSVPSERVRQTASGSVNDDRQRPEATGPQFAEFAKWKREWDPHGRFDSDWWRHQSALLAE